MKLRLFVTAFAWLLVGGVAFAETSAVDNYRQYYEVAVGEEIVVPTVAELLVTDLGVQPYDFLVFNQTTGLVVPHTLVTKTDRKTVDFLVSSETGVLSALSDGNSETNSHFPLITGGETVTKLDLISSNPVSALGIVLNLDKNVLPPRMLRVVKVDTENGEEEVLFTGAYNTGFSGARFPKTTSTNWRVELTHDQPLRITDISFVENTTSSTTERRLRFLAQPNNIYRLYTSTNGSKEYKSAPELAGVNRVLLASLSTKNDNPTFRELDSDNDGVVDRIDNCPSVANRDQADIDKSGKGDACEDFDVDQVPNLKDNCPNTPNQNQYDEDGDGIGDVCDEEESRLTEKYPWISWVGLLLAMLMIGSMFLLVRNEPEANKEEVA